MSEDIVTPTSLVQEVTTKFRDTKEIHDLHVEKRIAGRKLRQIVDQETELLDGNERGAANIDHWVESMLHANDDVEERNPGMGVAVGKMAEKTKESVMNDLRQTAEQYGDLTFSEDSDPTVVAKDDTERGAIMQAGKLLGYEITEDEENGVRMKAQQRHQVGGNLEKVIATRVNVGIQNLLTDYDAMSENKVLRRPVRRQIVAMTDHMAKTLRNQIK